MHTALVCLTLNRQMGTTGVMMNFIKITEDFWIGEVENFPEEARQLLKDEFAKRGIVLALFGRW
jgi:hypothetical protein